MDRHLRLFIFRILFFGVISAPGLAAFSATAPAVLPGDCPRGFAVIDAAKLSGKAKQLKELRVIFGEELRPADSFSVGWWQNADLNSVRYKDFNVSHTRLHSDHGVLMIQTRDEVPDHFVIDSRFPLARKIAESVIARSPPKKFSETADGRYFIENEQHMTSDRWIPKEVGVHRIDGKLAWPTAETMNKTFGLRSSAPMRFVRTTNPRIADEMQTHFNLEFVERMAAGEIPVGISQRYGNDVHVAYELYKFTKKSDWPKLQKQMRLALDITQDANRTARDRYEAREQLRALQYEIWHGVMNGDKPFWDGTSPEARLITRELKIVNLAERPRAPDAPSLPPPATMKGIGAKIKSWLPMNRSANRGADRSAEVKKPWLTRYREGDVTHITDPLVMAPEDVAGFLNDEVLESAIRNRGKEVDYAMWLKAQITHDEDSSGSSMLGERLQLKIWLYRHFPSLVDIELPSDIATEDRAAWLARAIEEKVGKYIRMPRVPMRDRDAYQAESIRYYSNVFQDAFSGRRWGRSAGDAVPSAGERDNAYRTLGLPTGASEEDVKRAYRKLAMALHPDRTGFDKAAEAKLQDINVAYSVLSGKTLRQNTPD